MATKIRTRGLNDEELLKKFKETTSGDYELRIWITTKGQTIINPPEGTKAIVVDMRNNRGAVNIHETQSNEWVDQVGTEEIGKIVIVLWNSAWHGFCIGSSRVGYIVQKT